MLKYVDTLITFREIPNEISLCINISGCPNKCPLCHSKYLWNNIGQLLDKSSLERLIKANKGITCVCFMGGDQNPFEISNLIQYVKDNFPYLLTGWYSGKSDMDYEVMKIGPDFYKVGPYIEEYGGLDKSTTNQKFYVKGSYLNKEESNTYYNVTNWFWNKYDSDNEKA